MTAETESITRAGQFPFQSHHFIGEGFVSCEIVLSQSFSPMILLLIKKINFLYFKPLIRNEKKEKGKNGQ